MYSSFTIKCLNKDNSWYMILIETTLEVIRLESQNK